MACSSQRNEFQFENQVTVGSSPRTQRTLHMPPVGHGGLQQTETGAMKRADAEHAGSRVLNVLSTTGIDALSGKKVISIVD